MMKENRAANKSISCLQQGDVELRNFLITNSANKIKLTLSATNWFV